MSFQEVVLRWQGQDVLDGATRDVGVDVYGGEAKLARRLILADEMGNCTGRDVEVIRGLVWGRKDFWVGDGEPVAASARLSIWLRCPGATAELVVEVNGHPVRVHHRPTFQSQDEGILVGYWHTNWCTVEVEAAWLHPGHNVVTLHTDDGSAWEILLETSRWPNRSSKSVDGGATWDFAHLGYDDCYDGEYLIRLELERYPAEGWMASPAFDLAATASGDSLGQPTQINRIVVAGEGDITSGTKIDFELRSGATPAYEPAAWSHWVPAQEYRARPGDRFAQWRATLRTDLPLATPRLRAVEVRADVETQTAPWGRLSGAENPALVYPSNPFGYQRPFSRTRMMRERWNLQEVVAGAKNDLEQMERIALWARDQWSDGWNGKWNALHFCPPWDGPVILEFGRHSLGVGMCTQYSTVFVHACASLGITAHHVIHQSHCTAEAWSDHWGKWVWYDVGGDLNDETRAVYRADRNGVPMSVLEARAAWEDQKCDGVEFVGRNAQKFLPVEKRLGFFDHYCIVLRNNQMTSPHPGELEHGIVTYHYDDYLWWRDAQTPALPYSSRTSSRPGDFTWTLNRTRIHLQRTGEPGVLDVRLETTMPNMARDRILGPAHHPPAIHIPADPVHGEMETMGWDANLGPDWQRGAPEDTVFPAALQCCEDGSTWRDTPAQFNWTLKPGANRLGARAVNAFCVQGPASWVTVEY